MSKAKKPVQSSVPAAKPAAKAPMDKETAAAILDEMQLEADRVAGGYFLHRAIEDSCIDAGLCEPGEHVSYDKKADGTTDIVVNKTDCRKLAIGKLKKDK